MAEVAVTGSMVVRVDKAKDAALLARDEDATRIVCGDLAGVSRPSHRSTQSKTNLKGLDVAPQKNHDR